jgi:MoaA/NifB/PqqE/SkfB family radical SAM enzyme
MKIPHERFCVLPWISLETSPIGTVRPCCLADDEIVDHAGKKFQLPTASFADIRESAHMHRLRTQFLQGERPQTCRKCWNEERAGRTSKRMHTLDRLKHIVTDEEWGTDAKPLMFLDLKLGNICNLKCRICGSWSSSQFAAEEINDMPAADRRTSMAYRMLKAGAWPRERSDFWQEIANISPGIKYIEFTGGEPFMISEHFALLTHFVEQGIAGGIEIHYNTNGTHFPEHAPEIWKQFKAVEIAFSLDDLGQRFEYQRTNARWFEVVHNIKQFQDLKIQSTNITLQVCCTINVFNIFYLPEFAQWVDQQDFDFVYWNMMHDAWYFSVATLPADAKEAIAHKFRSCPIPDRYQSELDRVLQFMMAGASTDGSIMKMKIKDLDRKRNQNMTQVEPELAAVYGYDFDT